MLAAPYVSNADDLTEIIDGINRYYGSIKSYKMETRIITKSRMHPGRPVEDEFILSWGMEGAKHYQTGVLNKIEGPSYNIDMRYNGQRTVRWFSRTAYLEVSSRRLPPLNKSLFGLLNMFSTEPGETLEIELQENGTIFINEEYEVLDVKEMVVDGVRVYALRIQWTPPGIGVPAVFENYYAPDLGYMPFGLRSFSEGKFAGFKRILKYQWFETDGDRIAIVTEFEGLGYSPPGSSIPATQIHFVVDPESVQINIDVPDAEFDFDFNPDEFLVWDEDLGIQISQPGAFSIDGLEDLISEYEGKGLEIEEQTVAAALAPDAEPVSKTVAGESVTVGRKTFVIEPIMIVAAGVILLGVALGCMLLARRLKQRGARPREGDPE